MGSLMVCSEIGILYCKWVAKISAAETFQQKMAAEGDYYGSVCRSPGNPGRTYRSLRIFLEDGCRQKCSVDLISSRRLNSSGLWSQAMITKVPELPVGDHISPVSDLRFDKVRNQLDKQIVGVGQIWLLGASAAKKVDGING